MNFEAIVRSSSAAILVTDPFQPDNPIVFANPAFTAITGYETAEVQGRNCRFLQGPDTDRNVVRELRDAIAAGEAIKREILNYRKSGEPFWNELSLSAIRDESGTVVGFVGIQSDVTERRRLQDAKSELDARFESLASNMPGYLFQRVLKPNGQNGISYFSPSIKRILKSGRKGEQVPPDLWGHMNPEDRETTSRAIAQSAADLSTLNLQFRLQTPGGERWVRNHSTPRKAPNGDVIWDGIGLDVTAEVVAEQRLAFLASHDSLTGLQNRELFRTCLTRAIEWALQHRRDLAVLKLDIDGFGEINNQLGASGADTVLRQVAHRLKGVSVGSGGSAARLGGDEFALVNTGAVAPESMSSFVEAIAATLAAPMTVEGKEISLEACIGAALFSASEDSASLPDQAATELERRTDLALRAAKQTGRGTRRVYSAENDERLQERMALRLALRQAVDEQQFTLHYQPVVDLWSGQIVGAEALVRWDHPKLGPQRPDVFIPLAETSGVIVPLGAWVLRRAMEQVGEWQAAGLQPPKMAVNVSGVQLQQPGFLRSLEDTLARTGADALGFELEVTEGILLDASGPILDVLRAIKRMKFGLAVDDFGAGHASFRYLRDFPFDKLKIDQMFVRQMVVDSSDASIVRAMVALANSLDMSVVAEGIETPMQRDFLRNEGCRTGQGFLFSRPLPSEAFAALLRTRAVLPASQAESAPAAVQF